MNASKVLWALLGLNVLLLALLVSGLTRPKAALAQRAQRPSDYLMVPGETTGGGGVVYIVDTTNGMLSAMSYDDPQRQLLTMQPIDLNRVFDQTVRAPAGDDTAESSDQEPAPPPRRGRR